MGWALAAFLVDRAAKWLALGLEPERIPLQLGPFVRIVEVWNTGINFGLLGGGPGYTALLLAGLAVAISAGLLWWTLSSPSAWHNLGCGIAIGGACSNALDRLAFGAVHDYLNVTCCGIVNPYAWNLADGAIVVGVAIAVLRR